LVVFSDVYENNNLSKWTTTVTDANCTSLVTNKKPYRGLYGAQYTTAAVANNKAYSRVTISAANTIYARAYFQYSATANYLNIAQLMSTSTIMLTILPKITTWDVKYRSAATLTTASPAPAITLSANRWHCVEIYAVIDASNGGYGVYLDGALIWSITGLDTDNYGGITQYYVGEIFNGAGTTHTVSVDNVVIDTAYIGLAAPYKSNITKTVNTVNGSSFRSRLGLRMAV
jgi:hypothetical protein